MLLRKSESSLEQKLVSLNDIFSSKSKSSKKKENLQGKDSDTKFSSQMLPWTPFKVR